MSRPSPSSPITPGSQSQNVLGALGRGALFIVLAIAFGVVEALVFVSEQGRRIFRGPREQATVRTDM